MSFANLEVDIFLHTTGGVCVVFMHSRSFLSMLPADIVSGYAIALQRQSLHALTGMKGDSRSYRRSIPARLKSTDPER